MNKKEILSEIEKTKQRLEELYVMFVQQSRVERTSNSGAYHKKKKLLDEASELWKQTLEPGDIVKVTGSRAGSYRRVKEIDNYGLIGSVVIIRNGKVQRDDSYNIITCGLNKITAKLKEDGTWQTYRDLLEELKNDKVD